MIQEKIREDMKKAMIARDPVRVTVLRGLMAAFTNELVAKMKKPDEALADADALTVIQRAIKQRKDSIEQFTKGGRKDLVSEETKELKIIEEYSPAMMGKKEINAVATKMKEKMGVTDKAKMGVLMGAVMKELKGKALGADVKDAVEALF